MSSLGGSSAPSSGSWRSGTHVGRYRVHRMIARGGMGEIYVAEFEAAPGKRDYRVLKRLIGATQGIPEQAQMFLDEGRLASMLRHPNIVAVHDVGSEAGTYYIAMEYLHGVDLRAVLKEVLMGGTTLPVDLAVRLAIGACAGMHHAHELGTEGGQPLQIVHRDISPQNLFITFEGDVKLLDFGVARSNRRDRETTTRGMKGKVPYMSPEQCLSRPIDRRSDIFSLGIILFELTVGARLFRGNSDYELMQQIVTGDVVPPRTLDPNYPPDLERIVLKALQKPVDKRYQTALEMQHDLEAFAKAAAIDVGPEPMKRFLRETFGAVPEAWKTLEDPPPRGSGPILIEKGEARQTVQMPVVIRPTPPAMRTIGNTPPSGSEIQPQRTIVGVAPSPAGRREPSGSQPTGREPSGRQRREQTGPQPTPREPSGSQRREPSGSQRREPSGSQQREPSGNQRREPSGSQAREPSAPQRTSLPETSQQRPVSAERRDNVVFVNPAAVVAPGGGGGAARDRATAPAPVPPEASGRASMPTVTAPAVAPGEDQARRRRLLVLGAVGAGVLLVALLLRLSDDGQHPATSAVPPVVPPPAAAPGTTGAPHAAAAPPPGTPRVVESADEPAAVQGVGNIIVTATRHHALFKLDGKTVSKVAPFQVDQLDASREHVLEASLGPNYPTVLQRFLVTPDQTVILNVRFDEGGGGRVVGSGAATGPTGAIRVESRSPCLVFIDGKKAGTAPLKIRVPVGLHRVRLEGEALGAPRAVEVKVNEGKVAVVSASL